MQLAAQVVSGPQVCSCIAAVSQPLYEDAKGQYHAAWTLVMHTRVFKAAQTP